MEVLVLEELRLGAAPLRSRRRTSEATIGT